MQTGCPFSVTHTENHLEIVNPANASHTMLAVGWVLLLENIFSFWLETGVGFYMLPLGILGVILIVLYRNGKSIRKTLLNIEKRTVTFTYSIGYSSILATETQPLADFSMLMLEFYPPKRTLGQLSLTLSGKGGHVEIFSLPVTLGTLATVEKCMPEMRTAVSGVAKMTGLKLILDTVPASSHTSTWPSP